MKHLIVREGSATAGFCPRNVDVGATMISVNFALGNQPIF
jgi:hypothetical protein